MVTKRAAAVALVSMTLAASGLGLSQSCSGAPASSNAPVTTPTGTQLANEEWVAHFEDKVALVKLCRDALHDPEARARYRRARAAQPSLAYGIGPDCRLIILGP